MSKQTNECYLTQDGKPSMFTADARPRLRRVNQVMLFDMLNDPWETHNLAAGTKYREVIAEHESMLAQTEATLIAAGSLLEADAPRKASNARDLICEKDYFTMITVPAGGTYSGR